MMAEDLKPNRMEVAKRALAQLIDRMHGDRLGIVVFAGQAYTQMPITADRSAAKALPRQPRPRHGATPRNRHRRRH
jgi:Ca-activated chloride channel family protein